MSIMVRELYEALRSVNVADAMAMAAARAVRPREAQTELATKADLALLKWELVKWMAAIVMLLVAVLFWLGFAIVAQGK